MTRTLTHRFLHRSAIVISIALAFSAWFLYFGKSGSYDIAKAALFFSPAEDVDLETGSMFDPVDVGVDASTGNFVKPTFSLGNGFFDAKRNVIVGGIGLTQASQLRFGITTTQPGPTFSISCDPTLGRSGVKAYVVATVTNDPRQNLRTLWVKNPRHGDGQGDDANGGIQLSCYNYKCRNQDDRSDVRESFCTSPKDDPCSFYSNPIFGSGFDNIYPFKVAFISQPQLVGDLTTGGTKEFSLDDADTKELQQLLDTVGGDNIRMGVGITQDVLGLDTALYTVGSSSSFAIAPASQNFSKDGGPNGSVTVRAPNGASYWKAYVDKASNFIGPISIEGGSGDGILNFQVRANTDQYAPRSGFMTIAGKKFTVNQAGPCSNPRRISVGQTVNTALANENNPCQVSNLAGDLYSFAGTAGQEISINISSDSFSPHLFLYDSAGRTIEEDPNTTNQPGAQIPAGVNKLSLPSSGTYYIAATAVPGKSQVGGYKLTLAGGSNCLQITANPSNKTVCAGGNAQFTARANGSSTVRWQEKAPGCNSFVDISDNPTATSNTLSLTGTPEKNGYKYRASFFSAQCSSPSYSQESLLTVNEASIFPTSQQVTTGGGTGSFTVNMSPAGSCPWTASAGADSSWITITNGSSGTGGGTVNYRVAANPGQGRIGTINIAGLTFKISQAAASGTILTEDFTNSSNFNNWRIIDNNNDFSTWQLIDPGLILPRLPGLFSTPSAFVDSRPTRSSPMDDELISPAVNANGCSQVLLSFSNCFLWNGVGLNDTADVDVSINNGLDWTTVLRMRGASNGPNTRSVDIKPAILANPLNTRVRFHYYNATNDSWWVVDNVMLKCVSCPSITVNPATIPAATSGISYSQTLTGSGGSSPYTFTLAGGRLPANMTLSPQGVLSGTTGQLEPFNFNVRVTDANGCSGVRSYTLSVKCPHITITPATISTGTTGAAYNQPLSAVGGVPPYAFTISSGAPPPGLILSAGGVLSGTPTQPGNFTFTVQAIDAQGCLGEYQYMLSITCPTIEVGPATLPTGIVNTAFPATTITGSGGMSPYTCALSEGSLPPGMNLVNCIILGTPTKQGSFPISVSIADANGCSGRRNFTLQIDCQLITLSPSTLPSGAVAVNYSGSLTQSGGFGNVAFSLAEGDLPLGLTLSADGVLSGVPITTGVYQFTVRATDSNGCSGSRTYSITINSVVGLQFFPLPRPIRLLDTRTLIPGSTSCTYLGQPIAAGGEIVQSAFNQCAGIPNIARALVGNATVIAPSATGGVTIYPNGQNRPSVPNFYFSNGETVASSFTVGLSGQGEIKIFSEVQTDLVIDVTGYFAPPAPVGMYYHALPKPMRLYDTRMPILGFSPCEYIGHPIPANGELVRSAYITDCGGGTIPIDAMAIVGNLTVISPAADGFAALYQDGQDQPLLASLNYRAGQIVPNAFTTGVDSQGRFRLFTLAQADFAVDIFGYYSHSASDVNGAGLLYYPLGAPIRLFDTRVPVPDVTPCEYLSRPLSAMEELVKTSQVSCQGQTIPSTAAAVIGNATVISPSAAGHVAIYPDLQTRPPVSNLNYITGQMVSNAFTVALGAQGRFRIFSTAQLDFALDLLGYYSP